SIQVIVQEPGRRKKYDRRYGQIQHGGIDINMGLFRAGNDAQFVLVNMRSSISEGVCGLAVIP
ncbi:MAG: hypothetical protein WCB93_08150, partial [Gallionella sp.]